MDARTFDEFVIRQQKESEAAPVNWERERDEWLTYLADLYRQIESFLNKYVTSGQIRLEYRSIKLNEEYIGPYDAQQMILCIGRQQVELVPIGTLFIGAKGRVDVMGPAGKAEILLVDSKSSGRPRILVTVGTEGHLPIPPAQVPRSIKWEWRIVTRPPERRFIEITQESLFQLIMEVANG